jgi:hypothetical protein
VEQVGVRDPLAGQRAEWFGLTGILDRQPDLQQPAGHGRQRYRCRDHVQPAAQARAQHEQRLGRAVALKTLRAEGSGVDVRQLFREARLLGGLRHPAIIQLYDCDYADADRTRKNQTNEHDRKPVRPYGLARHLWRLDQREPLTLALRLQ